MKLTMTRSETVTWWGDVYATDEGHVSYEITRSFSGWYDARQLVSRTRGALVTEETRTYLGKMATLAEARRLVNDHCEKNWGPSA